jgi:iron complex outermembrane recepter protein
LPLRWLKPFIDQSMKQSRIIKRHIACRRCLLALCLTTTLSQLALAQNLLPAEFVEIRGGQPSSLPTTLPATVETVRGNEIAKQINATDAEDALKYLPNLMIRKRYAGDYDHAVLASRMSGTGNSARSLVYVDGILLSNLLGNGAAFAPRWGMINPQAIERVDVLYGPFSAVYPGNSVGAVVDYVTRLPNQFEAAAQAKAFSQRVDLYRTHQQLGGSQLGVQLGSQEGAWQWGLSAGYLQNTAQPLTFASKVITSNASNNIGQTVQGYIADLSTKNQPIWVLGAGSSLATEQSQGQAKLAYRLPGDLLASYSAGFWRNETERTATSYLTDPNGQAVFSGPVNIAGQTYTLANSDFTRASTVMSHHNQALSIKTLGRRNLEWFASVSEYQYDRDQIRSALSNYAAAQLGGSGRLSDLAGTGWRTANLRMTLRPNPESAEGVAAHLIEMGLDQLAGKLRANVSDTVDWRTSSPSALFSAFQGSTALSGFYLQDSWAFASNWRMNLGIRLEQWLATDGLLKNASTSQTFTNRREQFASPKWSGAWQATPSTALKAAVGRAVRTPTVSELYQGSLAGNNLVNNDPNLHAERSWTGELSAVQTAAQWQLRATVFAERTQDALYSQTNVTVNPNVTNIQNIEQVRSKGAELALNSTDWLLTGLDFNVSLTHTTSIITQNSRFPASVGQWQPRVPRWRANLLLSYHFAPEHTLTAGLRHSGKQFGNLDNSDVNSNTYTGFSPFTVLDLRYRKQFNRTMSLALGVDNLGNSKYWAFHPYTQRSFLLELQAKL